MAVKTLRLLIIRNAYQQDAGGAEQYALNLAIALKRTGHRPILVTKVRKIHDKARQDSIKVVSGPWHNTQKWDRWYYLRYPLFTLWYIYEILRHRIDIVHPQSRDDFVFSTRAAKILRKPVIWTDHADLKYVLDNVNHYNPRMRGWVINAAKYAREVLCASNSEKKSIEQVAPELKKITVVHNGVFAPANVRPVPKPSGMVIGTNARLVPSKGIGELMQAFAKLKNNDTELWLLGGTSGNKDKYSRRAKELGILNRVKFWGYVEKPNDVVASMDIFVHASYHEAFSLAIIEAAMLERPIIATNVGGTPEIIDSSCGILVEPRDPEAIKSALEELIGNPELRQTLAKSAKKRALLDYEFKAIVEKKIIPIYERVKG